MAEGALGGTVETPFGKVKKEYLLVGGAALLVIGIAYYRSKKASEAAAATAAAGANTGINPATGYPFGSAEDAAAMANQGAYINPNQPYAPTGGGTSAGTPGTFTSNAQWAQFAEQYMYGNGSVQDLAPLSAALGKYLTGGPVTDDQKSLINQAIAIAGYPPVPGPAGYPPSINTAPPGNTNPPPSGGDTGQLPAPTGLWGGSGMFNRVNGQLVNNYIDTGWNPVPGAVKYRYEEHSAFGGQRFDTVQPRVHETVSKPNADHYITIRAVDKDGKEGLPATIVVHTHDNSY